MRSEQVRSCTSPSLADQNRSDIDVSAGPAGLMVAHPGMRLGDGGGGGPPRCAAISSGLPGRFMTPSRADSTTSG